MKSPYSMKTVLALLSLTPLFTSDVVAVPSGNSTITAWGSKQDGISFSTMLGNINPPGSSKGFIAASLSTAGPNYYYSWTRDSALVARAITYKYSTSYQNDPKILGLLKDYVTYQVNEQTESTVCNCLGEPKFNPDGSSFSGPWGRPQNDGPAERASTMILFAKSYYAQTNDVGYVSNTLKPAIYKDLDYIVNVWGNNCFDLWEEVNGVHFYTLMMMRHGLVQGSIFANTLGDSTRANTYKTAAQNIKNRIDTFWESGSNYIVVTQNQSAGVNKPSGLDVAVLLAANQGGLGDGVYTPGSDKVLATAVALEKSFASLYPINKNLPSYYGTAIGRYPEDTYNGNGNSEANPWFIATTTYAELYYRAISEWTNGSGVTVNSINKEFFSKFDASATNGKVYTPGSDSFNSLVNNVAIAADNFLSTVRYHQTSNGSLSEQFNRYTGFMTGARDLTWSHAAMVTALAAKAGTPSP
ncbi:glucoamylase b [Spinellus fusiger]|nr:glucoamylase b [Spinellus fusiger]